MSDDAVFEAKTYSRVDWHLIPFLFLCYILAYLDRVNLGFAKLQMMKELSLSDAAFASGAGIFFIGYFFFEVPSNIALKKYGARAWIARIMISWGIISGLMMFVKSEYAFYGMRFLLGIAEAGFFPGIIYYLTLWYPSSKRSTRTALFVAAIAVSGVIGNPISGAIMDAFSGALGLAGWQWLFLMEGIPSILVGIWVFFYLDSSIMEAKWLTGEQKALLARNLEAEESQKTQVRIIDAFKSGKVWALCAIYFTLMIGLYGISFWLPSIVKAFGVKSFFGVGLITAIPYFVAVVGMMILSYSSDRTGERRMHYICNVTAGAIGLVLSGVFASNPYLAILFGGGHRPGELHRQPRRLRGAERTNMGEVVLDQSLGLDVYHRLLPGGGRDHHLLRHPQRPLRPGRPGANAQAHHPRLPAPVILRGPLSRSSRRPTGATKGTAAIANGGTSPPRPSPC